MRKCKKFYIFCKIVLRKCNYFVIFYYGQEVAV